VLGIDPSVVAILIAMLTAATALVVQLQRLLIMTEQYMRELRAQNQVVQASLAAGIPVIPVGPIVPPTH
jgi:hypothetical protein